ncbi:glycosyltransferase family 2 protein [Agrococcus carbonis]|uniref:Glycosyl transferase family 2 n=1 Tax=Agrococcus carbonis TaxID=684552 RepID=A0A1H1M4N9_9MICO|nr:glycosyltransferase family 2 protein [Agrococcus carbonis]SDR81774.1 Glycosyl transferase family 2 [Agrococcus carbonis]
MSPAGGASQAVDPQHPVVSVVVPMRDVGEWVSQTVESLRRQTLEQIEVLLVDDGSSDDTVARAQAAIDGDPRFRILAGEGRGAARARNLGIAEARGDYLAFADGDDIIPADAYRILAGQAASTDAEMVVGNHLVMEPQRLTTRDQSLPIYGEVRTGITIVDEPRFLRDRVCWNRIIRRSSWQSARLAFADARRSNDIQAMTHAYCAFAFDVVPQPVYAYRRRVGSTSMTSSKQQPGPLRDHFTQEIACRDAVRRLRDDALIERYFAGILEFDIWAHGVAAVVDESPEFDEARDLLVELVASAPRASFAALDPVRRLAYGLIARRSWALARAIVTSHEGTIEAFATRDLDAQIAAAVLADREAHTALAVVLRSELIVPMSMPTTPDDEVVRLHALLRDVVGAGIAPAALTRHIRALVDLPAEAPPATLRAAAALAVEAGSLGTSARKLRDVAAAAAHGDLRGAARAVGSVRSHDVTTIVTELRPRHVRLALRRAARRIRR